ncbi:hypothetical protein OIU74_024687 [Salix koriyanagi]|uniref:RING-type domain-containing protein n=1 Tax=Salix koriyanagi TaxID=2511006 RepID=A0A9Q1A8R0_9ROSI|nr:hypothetical protein OIU74_024687 [Salix koriyanagi]
MSSPLSLPLDPVGRRFYFGSPLNLSRTSMHDSCDAKPLFQVSIFLQRKYSLTWKDSRSGELLLEEEYPSRPDSHKSFLVPPQLVSSPDSCISYLRGIVSDMLNLDDVSLCHDVASNIGSFVSDSAEDRAGLRGFYVSAHVVIVEDFVEEVDLDGIVMPIFDPDEESRVVVPRGASMSTMNKMKKESFCMKEMQEDGDESCSDSCVVCLEKFSARVELTRLPCKHIFHEKCIFDWLKKSTACPLCRCEVE